MLEHCDILREKYGITYIQYTKIECEKLACFEECTRLQEEADEKDPDTLTEKDYEKYLSMILKEMSATDLIKEIPRIEDIVRKHYTERMFDMKAAFLKKN